MKQKNILLVFTDQQRYDTLEAHGNPIIKTPNMDRLAAEGVSFSRAYTPCPVCVPARFSMHTGKLPHQTDCFDNGPSPDCHTSFMQRLQQSGYQTHGVGKMHFTLKGQPADALWGFDSRDFSEEGGIEDDFRRFLDANGYEHVVDRQGVRSEMYYIPQPSQLPARLHNTTWVADRSIEFLRNRNQEKPFLLMSSFIKPHPPFESPTPWNKLYRVPEMPLPNCPPNFQQLISYWNRYQNRYKYRDRGIDENLIRAMKAAYYAAISFVDYNIGRIFAYLDENKLWEDTLVVFTADHGEFLGDYNCFGKRSFLDSAARIPLLMKHPQVSGGLQSATPASLIDVYPTLLSYAGLPVEAGLPGEDLAVLASGGAKRSFVTGQFQQGENANYMLCDGRFKYIYSAPDQREWLFDLQTDPNETYSLAGNPMFTNKNDELRQALIDSLVKDGYTQPFVDGGWKPHAQKALPQEPDACLLFQDPPSSIPNIPGYYR